jgi:hypothetical protein
MKIHVPPAAVRLMTALVLLPLIYGAALPDVDAQRASDDNDASGRRDGFEVWLADQSDTRPGFGGQLLIYEGSDLMGRNARKATPIARLDLGAETADLCRSS